MRSARTDSALAHVDGWPINVTTLADAVRRIADDAAAGRGFAAAMLNLDQLVKLRKDAAFRKTYRAMRFIAADGAPVARLARRQNPAIARTTGADIIVPLCEEAARRQLPVFLFGADDDSLGKASLSLSRSVAGRLDICGTLAPGRNFDPTGAEAEAAIERIKASGARLCFLALGAPKQEHFAVHAIERGAAVGFICVGAGIDFLAGRQSRAPVFFREHGLEWLWRLTLQPSRLAMRYAQSAMVLLDLTIIGPLRDHLGTGRRL